MNNKKFIYAAVLILAFVLSSCSNLFTKREDADGISLAINVDGMLGEEGARSVAVQNPADYVLDAKVYKSDGTLLASKTAAAGSTATITISGVSVGEQIYVELTVMSTFGDVLFRRNSGSITLQRGVNRVGFDSGSSSTAVLLYNISSSVYSNNFIRYTNDYSSTSNIHLTCYDEKYPVNIMATDFDIRGNLYIAYKAKSSTSDNSPINYVDKVSPAGNVTGLLKTASGSLDHQWLAVDRTANLLYVGGTKDSTATIAEYSLSGTLIAETSSLPDGLISSSFEDECVTFNAGTGYMYYLDTAADTHVAHIKSFTVSQSGSSLIISQASDTTLTGSFKRDKQPDLVPFNFTYKSKADSQTGNYMFVADMKFFNGVLSILVNQKYWTDNNTYGLCSRGGLVLCKPSELGTTLTLTDADGSACNTFGISDDYDTYNGYRPGANHSTSAGDDKQSGFHGPVRIIALTPKKLYIADDGVRAASYLEPRYHIEDINRVVSADMTVQTKPFTLIDVGVEFDNAGTVDGSYYSVN